MRQSHRRMAGIAADASLEPALSPARYPPNDCRVVARGISALDSEPRTCPCSAACSIPTIAMTLLAAAVMLIGVAIWRTATGYWTGEAALETMLDGIGLIIIAVAVADVGKFLFEEEVIADRELRRPAEARGSLTKFMTIIIIALSLESLVLISKASRNAMSDIVYPGLLVLLAVLAMVGLGLFQKLSQNATAAIVPERGRGRREDEWEPDRPPSKKTKVA
jgi:hypothetical protein